MQGTRGHGCPRSNLETIPSRGSRDGQRAPGIHAFPQPRRVLHDAQVGFFGQRVKGAIARLEKIEYLHFDIVANVFQSVANVARRRIVAVAKGRRQDENLLHSRMAKYLARVTTGLRLCELLFTFPPVLFMIWSLTGSTGGDCPSEAA